VRGRPQVGVALLALVAAACGGSSDAPLTRKPGANVVLITLDTTRADYLGSYGKTDVATPNLDRLAAEGVRFDQSVTSIPLTLPAHTSIMTGSIPPEHGVRDNGGFYVPDDAVTLAEVLSGNGYRTGAVIGAYVLNRVWGLHQGFETYDDEFGPADPRDRKDLHEQRDGADVAASAERWLDAHGGERFFLWLHFYDPHYPYEPPAEYAARHPDDPYAGEIEYTDAVVGRVLDALRARGLYESTLIVVTGDHGEGLGEHREPDHGIYLYDSTVRVPLIVRAPGEAYRGVVHDLSRDIDLAPTVLDYLGIEPPPSFTGHSLLPLAAGRPAPDDTRAYSESFYVRYHYGWKEPVAARTTRYKFIDLPEAELYDLRADPGELHNVIDVQPEIAAEMKAWLDVQREGGSSGADVPEPQAMDPETLARLQSLGYLGGSAPTADRDLPDPKHRADVIDALIAASRATGRSLRDGDVPDALAIVERAVELEPNFMDGWQFLGTLYVKAGQPDRAIAALEKILAVNPDSLPAREALSKAYLAKGDARTALDLLDAILATTPSYSGAYFDAAALLVERGQPDRALGYLQRFLERHPDSHRALWEIGTIRLRQGRPAEARAAIERALAIEPRIRSAHFNLGLIAEQSGDLARAAEEYRLELETFPDHPEALGNLGVLYMRRGETDLGIAAFERLVAARPDDAVAHYFLARAYFGTGRADDRVLDLARRAVRLDPSLTRARELAAAIEARRRAGG